MDKLVTLGPVGRVKNSGFILESKMAETNQNKNSKQPDGPDAAWKLYLGNKCIAHLTQLFTRVLQNDCFKNIKQFKRKLSS